jgi:hypothetical protein
MVTINDLKFSYSSYDAFNDFINDVKIKAEFDKSWIQMSDLAYFAPELKGISREITLLGKVSGRISDIKGKDPTFRIRCICCNLPPDDHGTNVYLRECFVHKNNLSLYKR